MGQLHANLMMPPCQKVDRYQGVPLLFALFKHLHFQTSPFCPFCIRRDHPGMVLFPVSLQIIRQFQAGSLLHTFCPILKVYQRPVFLFHGIGFPFPCRLTAQPCSCRRRLGKHKKAGNRLIQPVYQSQI